MLTRGACDEASEFRMKARLAVKRADLDAFSLYRGAPRARLVETADGHRHRRAQAPNEIEDEALGASGRQTEHDLHHARLAHRAIHPRSW
jgi:hypothetical protein